MLYFVLRSDLSKVESAEKGGFLGETQQSSFIEVGAQMQMSWLPASVLATGSGRPPQPGYLLPRIIVVLEEYIAPEDCRRRPGRWFKEQQSEPRISKSSLSKSHCCSVSSLVHGPS